MSRFLLSPDADRDLDEIQTYLENLPPIPAITGGSAIVKMLENIARDPSHGATHSNLTRVLGVEVRSRLVHPYRIFYVVGRTPEIIAIFHTSRDIKAILTQRFQ